MNYNLVAHQTEYSDVLFRSRLEARWAALFDLLGWGWEYEPLDLNGWVPDFRLNLPKCNDDYYGTHHVWTSNPLVEVRPVDYSDECPLQDFGISRIYHAVGFDRETGSASCHTEVFLLGTNPEAAWKIPDLGQWDEPMHLSFIADPPLWHRAGNEVQWKGSSPRAKTYV